MKWLIVLLLISCGKHEEPRALDLNDSDGDQLRNYQESDFNQYIANITPVKGIQGTMSFNANTKIEIPISNQSDVKSETIKFIVGEMKAAERDRFFSEWTDLKLDLEDLKFEMPKGSVSLTLRFDSLEVEPKELMLIKDKASKSYGPWTNSYRINLSNDEFINLLNHRYFFSIKTKFPKGKFFNEDTSESIRKKTYRVFFNDGKSSEILYVSKKLSPELLLNHFDIKDTIQVTNEKLFFTQNDEKNHWFERTYPNGDMAVSYTSIQELNVQFLSRLQKTAFTLSRENGIAKNKIVLKTKPVSTVYFKVRPKKSLRFFSESTVTKNHRIGSVISGNDDSWACKYSLRKIKNEQPTIPELGDFFNSIDASLELIHVQEMADNLGIYWEMMFAAKTDETRLTLKSLPDGTFTTTGQFKVKCDRNMPARESSASYKTNPESYLRFQIESFVEKI